MNSVSRLAIAILFMISSAGASALCDTDAFGDTYYSVDIAPIDPIAGVISAGRMVFVMKMAPNGTLRPRDYIWGYDTYESAGGVGLYMGGGNKDKTRLTATRYKRSCYVTLALGGVTPVNGYVFQLRASGYASTASSAGTQSPDVVHLGNALMTYGGSNNWANVVLTRLR